MYSINKKEESIDIVFCWALAFFEHNMILDVQWFLINGI
jgi:hypothetical protein